MDLEKIIIYIITPLVISMATFIIRNITERLKVLEDKVQLKMSEEAVRQVVADKLDPLKEDITEIKESLTKLTNYIMGIK